MFKINMSVKKPKVCFIQSQVYPLFNPASEVQHGGSELQLFLLSKELQKRDYEISFIVGDFGQGLVEDYGGIKLIKAFSPKSSDKLSRKLFQSLKYLRIFHQAKADFYFTSAANATVGLVSFYCKIYRKKHIHRTAHQMDVDGSFAAKNGFLGKLYEYGLKNAKVLLTQAKDHQQILKRRYNKNAVLFKNCFPAEDEKESRKSGVLWVARAEEWKRPEEFIKLAKKLPKVKFTMICPPLVESSSYQTELKKQAQKMANLKFIDKVPFDEIQAYFDQAKVFVNTSIAEGFPNTFLQAASGKTPIVSLKVDPDGFLNRKGCGIACGDDFCKMAEAVTDLLTDHSKWEKIATNCYDYVRKNHNVKDRIDLLEKYL